VAPVGDGLQRGVESARVGTVFDVAREQRHAAEVQALDQGAIVGVSWVPMNRA
jgi:hypothetical protein